MQQYLSEIVSALKELEHELDESFWTRQFDLDAVTDAIESVGRTRERIERICSTLEMKPTQQPVAEAAA